MTERVAKHSRVDVTAEAVLEGLARLSTIEADATCDRQIARAIERWRLAEATEWHRVKLRLRWRRAMQARDVEPDEGS